MTEKIHARLSGSKIERALLCHGSVQAEAALPDPGPGDAALRGTAIHEIAESIMSGRPLPEQHTDKPEDWTHEARKYADAMRAYTTDWAKKRFVELRVTPGLQTIHPTLGGTADYVAIGGGRMLIADLKTGRVKIAPENNLQLMTYAVGAALQLNAPPSINITLAIYQNGFLNTWHCDYETIAEWKEGLEDLAAKVWADNPPRNPGAKACRYCRAKDGCPALADTAKEMASTLARNDFGLDATADDLFPLSGKPTDPIDMRDALDTADLLSVWVDAVREKAKRQIIDGQAIAGWKLKKGRRMVTLNDQSKAEAAAKDHPEAWQLKTPSALQKLNFMPSSLFRETTAAASLVRGDE